MFGMLGFVFCRGPIHVYFLCMICAFPRRNVGGQWFGSNGLINACHFDLLKLLLTFLHLCINLGGLN